MAREDVGVGERDDGDDREEEGEQTASDAAAENGGGHDEVTMSCGRVRVRNGFENCE